MIYDHESGQGGIVTICHRTRPNSAALAAEVILRGLVKQRKLWTFAHSKHVFCGEVRCGNLFA
jgi:hypothetical protein